MTEHDRGPFAELMFGLGETYGEAISDARMEIYFRALSDLSLEDIRQAVDVQVRTQKFFPRPSELRDAAAGSLDDQAELAWVSMLQMVRRCGYYWDAVRQGPLPWPDDATKRATLELFGGWKALCERLPGSGPELLGVAKQFKATYRSYAGLEARQIGEGETVVKGFLKGVR